MLIRGQCCVVRTAIVNAWLNRRDQSSTNVVTHRHQQHFRLSPRSAGKVAGRGRVCIMTTATLGLHGDRRTC